VALVDIGMADEVDQALAAVPAPTAPRSSRTLIPLFIAGHVRPVGAQGPRRARRPVQRAGLRRPDDQKQIDAVLCCRRSRRTCARGGSRAAGTRWTSCWPGSARPRRPCWSRCWRIRASPSRAWSRRSSGWRSGRARSGGRGPHQAGPGLARDPGGAVAGDRLAGRQAGHQLPVQKAQSGSERDAVAATQALQQRRDPSLLPDGPAHRGRPQGPTRRCGTRCSAWWRRSAAPRPSRACAHHRQRPERDWCVTGPTRRRWRWERGGHRPALEAFPEKASYKKEDVADFLVKDITKLGPRPAPLAGSSIASALARMTCRARLRGATSPDARRSLGGPADAPAVLKLAGDKGTVRGFPPGTPSARRPLASRPSCKREWGLDVRAPPSPCLI
jgi:hypothetical protein